MRHKGLYVIGLYAQWSLLSKHAREKFRESRWDLISVLLLFWLKNAWIRFKYQQKKYKQELLKYYIYNYPNAIKC